jgi:DNA-binding CsgD family transcriptional regulator
MGLMVQIWGLHFATADFKDAVTTVTTATILSAAIFFVSISLPQAVSASLVYLLPILSAVCSLLIRDTDFESRSTCVAIARQLRTFWLVRILYGLGIGLLIGILAHLKPMITLDAVSINLGAILGTLILAGAAILLILQKAPHFALFLLPALPLIAISLFSIFLTEITNLYVLSTMLSWLCFMILSSIQISYFKTLFGMSSAQIAFKEKSVVLLTWTLTFYIGWILGGWFQIPQLVLNLLVGTFAGVIIIATVIALSRFAAMLNSSQSKDATRSVSEIIRTSCHSIAAENHLTKREEEILVYIATGKSILTISDTLTISVGTCKTHLYHIYQKLDVHKNIEVLEMVNDYIALSEQKLGE